MAGGLGPTVIEGARWKAGLSFVGCVGFVLLGIWILQRPDLAQNVKAMIGGWAAILFFGALAPLNLASAISPPRLTLTVEGFTIERALRGKRSWAWADIGELFLFEVRSTRIVSFTYREGRQPTDPLTTMGANLGAPGSFGGAWTMAPNQLLELACRYRAAATST